MDKKNRQLISLLRLNARASISNLAKRLNLSRTAVHARLNKLELQGLIQGYTVKLNPDYERHTIGAHVMIAIAPQANTYVVTALKKIPEIQSLHAVSGAFDLLATVQAESTMAVDEVLDQIGKLEGVEKTQSSIILSTKFVR